MAKKKTVIGSLATEFKDLAKDLQELADKLERVPLGVSLTPADGDVLQEVRYGALRLVDAIDGFNEARDDLGGKR